MTAFGGLEQVKTRQLMVKMRHFFEAEVKKILYKR